MFGFEKKSNILVMDTEVTAFEIVTLHTAQMRLIKDEEIVMKDGVAEVSEYHYTFGNGSQERILQRRVTVNPEDVIKLLNECKILSWNGFSGKHPKGVTDGTMFHLKATVNNKIQITASGSENFPKNFRVLTDGFYKFLSDAPEE